VIRVRPTDASYFNFKIQSFQVEVAPEDRKKQAHVPNIRIIDRGGGFSAKMHDLLSFETNVNAYIIKTGVVINLKYNYFRIFGKQKTMHGILHLI
jgi:hypothetical protein